MKTVIKKNNSINPGESVAKQDLKLVCQLLNYTVQAYCDYLFEQYYLYIEKQYPAQPNSTMLKLMYSKRFRNFWNLAAWEREQTEFLPYAIEVTEEILVINLKGRLEIVQTVPAGSPYLVEEWQYIHSYGRMMKDQYFVQQSDLILETNCYNL